MIDKHAKRREGKEGFISPNYWNILNYYAGNPYTYIHFTNSKDLIGINPKTKYSTPAGIYGYPLTLQMLKELTSGSFAVDRKYIVIFEAKNKQAMLNVELYNYDNLNDDINKLVSGKMLPNINIPTADVPNAFAPPATTGGPECLFNGSCGKFLHFFSCF